MIRNKRTWRNKHWLLVSLILTILGAAIYFFYGQGYNKDRIGPISVLMMCSFSICLSFTYFKFQSKKNWLENIVNLLIVSACAVPFIAGIVFARKCYDQFHLKHYPQTVFGKKIGTEYTISKSGTIYHYSTFEYTFKENRYKLRLSDRNSKYQTGDSIKLKISYMDPEIYSIQEKIRD
jgi:hypothetical protein